MARQRAKGSGADHSVMRELNRSLILDLLRQQSPISRASIAKITRLAKPTVSAIVDELINEKLVREIGIGKPNQGGGRPPILLEFNARSQFLVGVHVGVRRTTIVVSDAIGVEVGRLQNPTPRGRPGDALKKIASLVKEAMSATRAGSKRLAAVGVCVPGLVDIDAGICRLAPNLGWREVPISEPLEKLLGVPIYLHNVSQAAAVAENLEGAAQEVDDLIFLYAGTGIGAGIVSHGRIYRGGDGFAGEIGHCRVPGAQELCNCGKVGCLETVASGPAIARAAVREAKRNGSALTELAASGRIQAEDVAAAAGGGDELALRILAEAGRELGVAASWLVNLFNPRMVVVGGGLAGAGEPFLGPFRETTVELALPQALEGLSIVSSSLGKDADVRGAVLVARQSAESYYRVVLHG